MIRQAETEYFMSVAAELRAGWRDGKSVRSLRDLYDELEGLAFTTDNPLLRERCEAMLQERGVLRDAEIERVPFYGDRAQLVYLAHRNSLAIGYDFARLDAIYLELA